LGLRVSEGYNIQTYWIFLAAVMEDVDSWSELSAQELIEKRDSIEAEIKAQNDILEGVSRGN
jgi:hypothetical protein